MRAHTIYHFRYYMHVAKKDLKRTDNTNWLNEHLQVSIQGDDSFLIILICDLYRFL